MKTASDELFRLIKSLSKSEKRYFTLYAERHVLGDKNNYLKIFEAVESQDNYNEDRLKEQFRDNKFSSYFPAAKQYLHNLLLDGLHNFHVNSSIEQQINKHIHSAIITLNKGLTKQATKQVSKAKKQAYLYEKFAQVLQALEVERQIEAKKYYKDVSAKQLQKIYDEGQECIEKLENQNLVEHLLGQMLRYQYQKGTGRSEEDIRQLDKLMSHPILEKEDHMLSYRAKLDFYQIHAVFHFLKREMEEAYAFNKKYLELMESQAEKIREFPRKYLSTLNNFLIDSLVLQKYDAIDKGLEKMRSLPEQPAFKKLTDIEVDIFRLSYMLELNKNIASGDFDKSVKLMPELEAGLYKYENKIVKPNLIAFNYLIAYSYFGVGNYDKSADWLNNIIHDTEENVSQDIFAFARILHLIVHYELHNLNILEYLFNSAQRYLSTRKRLFKLESVFLRFIKKLSNINILDKKKSKELFIEFRKELGPLTDDPYEKKAFDYFDFLAWLDSKIEDISFQKAYKKRLNS